MRACVFLLYTSCKHFTKEEPSTDSKASPSSHACVGFFCSLLQSVLRLIVNILQKEERYLEQQFVVPTFGKLAEVSEWLGQRYPHLDAIHRDWATLSSV
jgi:hypothetical protein